MSTLSSCSIHFFRIASCSSRSVINDDACGIPIEKYVNYYYILWIIIKKWNESIAMWEHYIFFISIVLLHKSSRCNYTLQIMAGNSIAREHFNTKPSIIVVFTLELIINIYSNLKWRTNKICFTVDRKDELSHVEHMLSRRMCYTKKNTDACYVPNKCFLQFIAPKPWYSCIIIIVFYKK
jgi:hypothetical protein